MIKNINNLLIICVSVLLCHIIKDKYIEIDIIIGIFILFLICITSICLKRYIKILPSFAICSILGFILTMPNIPTNFIVYYVDKIDIAVLTIPIITTIGLSIGNNIIKIKNMSWKIIVISLVVYFVSYFGCALFAEIMLKLLN